jgi:uncharacterized short protein YbdD (DUF466 family)
VDEVVKKQFLGEQLVGFHDKENYVRNLSLRLDHPDSEVDLII